MTTFGWFDLPIYLAVAVVLAVAVAAAFREVRR